MYGMPLIYCPNIVHRSRLPPKSPLEAVASCQVQSLYQFSAKPGGFSVDWDLFGRINPLKDPGEQDGYIFVLKDAYSVSTGEHLIIKPEVIHIGPGPAVNRNRVRLSRHIKG